MLLTNGAGDSTTYECPYWDLLPPLSAKEYEELKASIQAHGIKTAITVLTLRSDEWRVIDGYNRLRIAEELRLSPDDVPLHQIGDDTDFEPEQEEALAAELNLKRRHLTTEQRQEWAIKLRQQKKSYREIADLLGASKSQVQRDLSTVPNGTVELPDKVKSRDGIDRPAKAPPKKEDPPQEEKQPPLFGAEPLTERPLDHDATAALYPRSSLSIDPPEKREARTQAVFDQADIKRCEWYEKCDQPAAPPARYCLGHIREAREAIQQDPFFGNQTKETDPEESVEAPLPKASPQEEPTRNAKPEKTEGVTDVTPSKNGQGYQHYCTPEWFLERVRKVNQIALDPCSNQWSKVHALLSMEAEHDGLHSRWSWSALAAGRNGLVYLNPPYADPLPWAERLLAEIRRCEVDFGRPMEAIWIAPCKPSRKWHKLLTKACDMRLDLDERVCFEKEGVPDENPIDDSTVFYFGPNWVRFCQAFEGLGTFLQVYELPDDMKEEPTVDPRQRALPGTEAPSTESPALSPSVEPTGPTQSELRASAEGPWYIVAVRPGSLPFNWRGHRDFTHEPRRFCLNPEEAETLLKDPILIVKPTSGPEGHGWAKGTGEPHREKEAPAKSSACLYCDKPFLLASERDKHQRNCIKSPPSKASAKVTQKARGKR